MPETDNSSNYKVPDVEDGSFSIRVIPELYAQMKPRLDVDKNGDVSKTEIFKAIESSSFKGNEARMVAFLAVGYESLAKLDSKKRDFFPTISDKDIRRVALDKANSCLEKANEPLSQANSSEKLSKTAKYFGKIDLSPESLWGENGISYKDGKQGFVGDCFFISAAAAIANSRPDQIKSMISLQQDGSYKVRFPGLKGKEISVSPLTESERLLYAQPNDQGNIWMSVLEKAFGQLRQEHNLTSIKIMQRILLKDIMDGFDRTAQQETNGGDPQKSLYLLTGKRVEKQNLVLSSEAQIVQKLKECTVNKVPMACSTSPLRAMKSLMPGLYTGHAYTVLSYDEASGRVKLRNPWGKEEPTDSTGKPLCGINDGEFDLSITDFKRNFSDAYYATDRVTNWQKLAFTSWCFEVASSAIKSYRGEKVDWHKIAKDNPLREPDESEY